MDQTNKIVSFDDEKLILVDRDDHVLGYETKDKCHNGNGLLHRAFSIFIFNDKHELLLQQRSQDKRLWGLFWSNTCCSHPRKGEAYEEATVRRLKEELNLDTDLHYLFKFQYQAPFEDKGSENELCSVYVGKSNAEPEVNETEIADWRYVSISDLNRELEEQPQRFTPWFKMEWKRISEEYMDTIKSM